jgi:drug/metabolite transporter (DMT)-like permease
MSTPPQAPIPRWLGAILLLAIATCFGSNHISARIAFDHGANVLTAVAARSAGTALILLAMLHVQRMPLKLPRTTLRRGLGIGLILAVQGYCLYSAVAMIPVALALLVFNTFPLLLALISWGAGGERPARRTLITIPITLVGLALALDISGAGNGIDFARRWQQIGAGVAYALTGGIAFATVMFLTTRWLADVDGRVRSLMMMTTVALVVLLVGGVTQGFALPADAEGWLGLVLLTLFYGTAITSLFVVLPRMGAVNNAPLLNLEPIAVLFLGWAILGQAVAPVQIVGALIVVGAITYLASGKQK